MLEDGFRKALNGDFAHFKNAPVRIEKGLHLLRTKLFAELHESVEKSKKRFLTLWTDSLGTLQEKCREAGFPPDDYSSLGRDELRILLVKRGFSGLIYASCPKLC